MKKNRRTISAKKYQKKMDEIIAMGKPVADTLVEMLEEAGKYNLSQKVCKKHDKIKWVDFSPMRQELYCKHGVGHGFHVHGCDGCCSDKSFAKEFKKRRKNVRKNRKR